MRSFWKAHSNSGLESYLKDAIVKRIRYCHAFPEIPKVSVGTQNAAVEERVFEAAKNAEKDAL